MLRRELRSYGFSNSLLIIEGSLEVKLPTIWTDAATVVRAVREEKESKEKESIDRKIDR